MTGAVLCKRKRLEYIAKPTTMVAVIVSAVLLMRGPHDVWQAPFFLAGFAFSLAGDVLLMLPYESTFVYGLAAFLVAQICYIVGLTPSLPPLPPHRCCGSHRRRRDPVQQTRGGCTAPGHHRSGPWYAYSPC